MKEKAAVWKYFSILNILILLSIATFGCGTSNLSSEEVIDNSISIDNCSTIKGIDSFMHDLNYQFLKKGIFHLSENKMLYYDFSSKDDYVLCGNDSCRHKNMDCPAWYGSDTMIYGAALVNDKVYYFQDDLVNNEICFITQTVLGDEKKILFSYKRKNYSSNSYILNTISNTYYSDGFVWFVAEYSKVSNKIDGGIETSDILMGINLDSGNTIQLTDLREDADGSDITSQYKYIGNGYIFYVVEECMDSGDLVFHDQYFVYDISNKKKEMVHESDAVNMYVQNTKGQQEFIGKVSEISVLGYYNNAFLCKLNSDDNIESYSNDKGIYLYDFYNDHFTEIKNDIYGFPFMENGIADGVLIDSRFLLYAKIGNEEDKITIFSYDLETGKSESLFEDEKSVTYRLVSQVDNILIVKIYNFNSTDVSYKLYRMLSEDYLKGNFHEIEIIKL